MSDRVASWLTPQFQDHLKGIGWPPDLADKLSVKHTSGYLQPHFSGTDQEYEQVQDLEFGTPDIPPSGAIFNFFEHHQTKRQIKEQSSYSAKEVLKAINRIFS